MASPDTPDLTQLPWLLELRNDLLSITTAAARELWPSHNPAIPCFNYRYEHVKQVEREALRLRQQAGGDAEVLLAAVWLHDRFQPAFRGDNHGLRAAAWARDSLPRLGFSSGKTRLVCDCVDRHSSPFGELPQTPPEPRLLWDADKLAHLGPGGDAALAEQTGCGYSRQTGSRPGVPERTQRARPDLD